MRFSPDFLDELRSRLPVSEVVGRRVKLTKAGREWKGLSPFNKEKTASFFVNDEKQAWFDFSSGKNGSIFDFVMQTEGVGFPEAVERLASMAGMPLPVATPDAARQEQHRRTLYDVIEMAARFFTETLASREGAKARGYLADRGLTPALQTQFRLGYAPGSKDRSTRFALKEYLGKAGVSVEDMIEAELLVHGDDIPVPYDRFRDRVMFPITDVRGRVIAFGGRALEKDVPAKYLNSPEMPLFHKGHTLYNIAAARKATHDGARLIVVEGYVDVIAMASVGFAATVAPLGTALTEAQLQLLWKMADEPVLCFDGDKAGQRAAYRAIDLALPHLKPGKSLQVALLPEGQDPDDLVRIGGRVAVDEVLASARPLADMVWRREITGGSFDTPERRAALEARIGEITRSIGDETVRHYYRQDLTERLRGAFAPPQAAMAGRGARGPRPESARWGGGGAGGTARRERGGAFRGGGFAQGGLGRGPYQPASPQLAASPLIRGQHSALSRREALILETLINHPWLLHDHLEEAAALELAHPEAHRLRAGIIAAFAGLPASDDPADEARYLREALGRNNFSEVIQRVESAITTGAVWGARPGAAQEDVLATWRQLISLHRQWHALLRELKDAEAALANDGGEADLAWLRDVKRRLAEADGLEALIEGFGQLSGRSERAG